MPPGTQRGEPASGVVGPTVEIPAEAEIPAPVPARRGRQLLLNLALAVVSLLCTVVGLEAVCWLAGFQTTSTWSSACYERVAGVGHLFRPGFQGTMYKGLASGWRHIPVRINSHGLRGADFPLAKSPGTRRVLVVGDSFTFGYLLDEGESSPALLQSLLDQRPGVGPVQVINAGIPGYSIYNERGYLEQRGLAFAPDVVVLNVSPGDISDVGSRDEEDETAVNPSAELRVYYSVRASALMNALQYGFLVAVHHLEPTLTLTRGLNAPVLSPAIQGAWDRYTRELARVAELTAAHHVPLVVVIFPSELQLYSNSTVVGARWKDMVAGQGAALVDLLPAFKAARDQALYLPADGHPTGAANRIAAHAVAAWLADRWHDDAARTD